MVDVHEAQRERVSRELGPRFVGGSRRVAMVYPSPYRTAMSSLGYQWITTLLREAGIAAERAFLPDDPQAFRKAREPVITAETGTPLHRFPLLAVSLAYELEITGLFELLDLCRIPIRREDRSDHHPKILLGGPITMSNPLTLAPFVDAMLLGEAEHTAPAAVSALFDTDDREAWLDAVAKLPGAFVPERDGTRLPIPTRAQDDRLPARSTWLSPDAELSSMFLLEGERGCHRQCTFCVMRRGGTLGGMRLVGGDRLRALIPEEARKVGLVGAAISDHPELPALLETLVSDGRQVSVSSLRADRVAKRPAIAHWLRASGAKTLTVASDGASERLRATILKKSDEEDLLTCAKQAGALRYDVFKVYMMLGLPTETEADVDELIRFTLEQVRAASPARVALGVAPFVAKFNTPLDGEPYAGIAEVDRRVHQLTRGLKGRAQVRPVSARWAWIEYELAQGGPETGLAAFEAWRAGGTFGDWKRALAAVEPHTRRPWAAPPAPVGGALAVG